MKKAKAPLYAGFFVALNPPDSHFRPPLATGFLLRMRIVLEIWPNRPFFLLTRYGRFGYCIPKATKAATKQGDS